MKHKQPLPARNRLRGARLFNEIELMEPPGSLQPKQNQEIIECVAEPMNRPAARTTGLVNAAVAKVGIWIVLGFLLLLLSKFALILVLALFALKRFPKVTLPSVAGRFGSLYARGRKALNRL